MLFVTLSDGYTGVRRYYNGTDVEIQEFNEITRCCGDCYIGRHFIRLNENECGYVCETMESSYHNTHKIGLSCKSDQEIRQQESK